MATFRTDTAGSALSDWCNRYLRAAGTALFGLLVLCLAPVTLYPQASAQPADQQPVRVAAASDLRFALDDIAAVFQRDSGYRLRITYGSTGNFAHQIRHGAPFHLFLAADEGYVDALASDRLTQDAGTLYAIGRLALVVPRGVSSTPAPTLTNLHERLAASPGQRFAIANPAHAPYGERARDVLEHQGLWEALQPQLVLGENVSQAAQFALSGSTVGGLVAWSLALAPRMAARADSTLIPADWHRPLKQRMVLLRGATEGAHAFYAYLQESPAREVLRRYGFSLPADRI